MSFEQAKHDILGDKDYPNSVVTQEQQQKFDEEFKQICEHDMPELLKLVGIPGCVKIPTYTDPNFNRYMDLGDKIINFMKICQNKQ